MTFHFSFRPQESKAFISRDFAIKRLPGFRGFEISTEIVNEEIEAEKVAGLVIHEVYVNLYNVYYSSRPTLLSTMENLFYHGTCSFSWLKVFPIIFKPEKWRFVLHLNDQMAHFCS